MINIATLTGVYVGLGLGGGTNFAPAVFDYKKPDMYPLTLTSISVSTPPVTIPPTPVAPIGTVYNVDLPNLKYKTQETLQGNFASRGFAADIRLGYNAACGNVLYGGEVRQIFTPHTASRKIFGWTPASPLTLSVALSPRRFDYDADNPAIYTPLPYQLKIVTSTAFLASVGYAFSKCSLNLKLGFSVGSVRLKKKHDLFFAPIQIDSARAAGPDGPAILATNFPEAPPALYNMTYTPATYKSRKTIVGIVFGAGFEMPISSNFSFTADGLVTWYGSKKFKIHHADVKATLSSTVVTVGVKYKLY